MKPAIYDEHGEIEIKLPTIKVICPTCIGEGTTTRHVEPDGGFSGSEWAEMDYEFRESYIAGRYDRPCPECKGLRVIDDVDEARCAPDVLQRWYDQLEAEYAHRRDEEAERRAGC